MAGRSTYSLLARILLIGLLWPIATANAACSKKLSVAFLEVEPFYHLDSEGRFSGLDVELIEHIFKTAGCEYKLKVITWKRAIEDIKHGTLDVALNASITPDRQKFAYFSVPYRKETMVMYMRSPEVADFKVVTLADVAASSLNVGVTLGGWYGNEYARLYAMDSSFRQRILKTSDEVQLFNWLQAGRIDIAFNDLISGVHTLRMQGKLAEISIHPLVINNDHVHLILSRATVPKEDVDTLNSAIETLRGSTVYTELLAQYASSNYMRYLSGH